jgi:uncharacterized protein with FMN-binding domain
MKRTPIVLAATVAGLAGTFGFKAAEPSTTAATAVSSTDTGTASDASSSSGTGSSTSSGSSGSTSSTSSTEQASSTGTKTVTTSAATQYGEVTLKVTLTNGKVAAVENVALPANDPHSQQISTQVGSTLQQSALSHADGQVDAISGATYTSDGYAQALQAAVDQASSSTSSSTS